MKIKKVNAGGLTNFEVLQFLRSRHATRDPMGCLGSVAPSECKVFDYLVQSVAGSQTRESINTFLAKCEKFNLATAEKLNIINSSPVTLADIYPMIEHAEERFGDDKLQELVDLVIEVLPPPPGSDEQPTN